MSIARRAEVLRQREDQRSTRAPGWLNDVERPVFGHVPPSQRRRLHVFPGDDVGAQGKLRRLLAIETSLGYEDVRRLVARWHPFAGVVYFHLLLDSLARSNDGPQLVGPGMSAGKSSARGDAV
jgi:hypothetical protein